MLTPKGRPSSLSTSSGLMESLWAKAVRKWNNFVPFSRYNSPHKVHEWGPYHLPTARALHYYKNSQCHYGWTFTYGSRVWRRFNVLRIFFPSPCSSTTEIVQYWYLSAPCNPELMKISSRKLYIERLCQSNTRSHARREPNFPLSENGGDFSHHFMQRFAHYWYNCCRFTFFEMLLSNSSRPQYRRISCPPWLHCLLHRILYYGILV